MTLLKNELSGTRAVTVILAALLLLPCRAIAFPLISEIRPFGEYVVANGYGRRNANSPVSYTETYLDDPMSKKIRAVYWNNDGAPISYKELVFRADPNIPAFFEKIDYRRKKGYRVNVRNNIARVRSLRIQADGRETVRRSTNVEINANTVIDASFHRYLMANWDQLVTEGKRLKLDFLQVEKARLVPLKIKTVKCRIKKNTCFKISFDNLLLQTMAPKIYMDYETHSRRLIRYSGLGPVTELNGKGIPIEILYEYM